MHKEFRGEGGLRGSWGWGLRSNFGAPFLYVYVLFGGLKRVDERQIPHLICARLKYDLYDFFRAVLGLLPALFLV